MVRKAVSDVSERRSMMGQALVELTVFGTIFLLLLGAMINYGLRYDYNQEAQMRAFRAAMRIASDNTTGSGSYMTMAEKHLPDPLDPHGAGSTIPVMASASVTRDFMALQPPEIDGNEVESLPTVVIDRQARSVNNEPMGPVQRMVYRTAGYRQERRTDLDVAADDTAGQQRLERLMTKYSIIYDNAHFKISDTTGKYTGEIQITDACVGQVIDYDGCYEQARKIIDRNYCELKCREMVTETSDIDCAGVCNSVMNAPNQNPASSYNATMGGPWYAHGAQWHDGDFAHQYQGWYTFPILDDMFEQAGIVVEIGDGMGLQGDDTTTDDTRSARMRKSEFTGSILTEEDVQWSTTTTGRRFIRNNNMGADGWDVVHSTPGEYVGHTESIPMDSEWQGQIRETWRTTK